MTESFLNASMEARKGAMKMKLVRAFIAFVVVSLFVGISSAFNGQDYVENNEKESTNYVEKVEIDNTSDNLSTEIVDKDISEQVVEEQNQTSNSFSESKEQNVETNKKEVKNTKTTTTNNQTTIKQNQNAIQDNNQPIEKTQEPKQEKKETKEETTNIPTPTDEQYNAMYYSITKGIAEYSTLAECNSVGNRIKNNELDEILDWNENNPDNFKQPIIKAHWCYEVMKNGKIHYFLHFITETGANMDSELKNKY